MAGKVRLRFVVLAEPRVPRAQMLADARAVYGRAGIEIELLGERTMNAPQLEDLEAGECNDETTTEQEDLFAERAGAGATDLVVYFVRTTIPPYNGCAVHPPNAPGAVVAAVGSQWTLGHEVGHVLGLAHVDDDSRMMTGNGTSRIVGVPVLTEEEVEQASRSPYFVKD